MLFHNLCCFVLAVYRYKSVLFVFLKMFSFYAFCWSFLHPGALSGCRQLRQTARTPFPTHIQPTTNAMICKNKSSKIIAFITF